MGRGLLLGFCLSLGLFAGCANQPDSYTLKRQDETPRDTIRRTEMQHDPARVGNAARSGVAEIDVTRYTLSGAMDWAKRILHASVEIQLKLLKSDLDVLLLDSHVPHVRNIVLPNGDHLRFDTITPGKLKIYLDGVDPLTLASSRLTFKINYQVQTDSLPNGNPSALVTVLPRKGDPNPSRIVYSFSEPYGAAEWMPCHNDPRDRAEFATDFVMDPQERLISNGGEMLNRIENGKRRMQYATSYTIPTYLMAFAIGEFTTYHRQHGQLPLSLWVRKGIPIEGDRMLAEIEKMMTQLETLMIPYPYEKYALVLVPEFPSGGLENVSITFQSEVRSSLAGSGADLGLTAHELAHQWWGDYVTVESWDDLWIKEGMASLLGEEVSREYEDKHHSHRLFGSVYTPKDGDAIRDKSLLPDDKYTTGPYDRAAWWLTQVRGTIGEQKFWATIRQLLKDHAFGYIGTDEFIEAFRPHLGDSLFQIAKAAVDAKKLPEWKAATSTDEVTLELHDPENTAFAKMDAVVHTESGVLTTHTFGSNTKVVVPFPAGSLLALDTKDVHALTVYGQVDKQFSTFIAPLLVPKKALMDHFLGYGPHVQALALEDSSHWELEPASIQNIVTRLGSENLKYMAVQKFCEMANRRSSVTGVDVWTQPLGALMMTPPIYGVPSRSPGKGFSACAPFINEQGFATWWHAMKNGAASLFNESLLSFLALIPQKPAEALATWQPVVRNGSSIRAQTMGMHSLLRHVRKKSPFEQITGNEQASYKDAFRNALAENESAEVRGLALEGLIQLKDSDSLPIVAKSIRNSNRPWFQLDAICAAYRLSEEGPDFWNSFLKELGDISTLSERLRETLENPKVRCNY